MLGLSRKEKRTKEIAERLGLMLQAVYAMHRPDQVQVALRLGVYMEQLEKESAPLPRGPAKDAVFAKTLRTLQEQQEAGGAHADEVRGAVQIAAAGLCECWLYFKTGNLSGGRKTYDDVTTALQRFISQAIGPMPQGGRF